MSAEIPPRALDATTRPDVKFPKWRYVYFLLAAFDLLTVSAGLYLNHQIMEIYTGSVEENRIWADRVAAYSHLGELAELVNTPGNNVFDSRNVALESQRMYAAVAAFDHDLAERRQELQDNLEPAVAIPLLEHFTAIVSAKTEMVGEAERIFAYFRSKQPDLAGERMATMDHKYAKLNGALLELRRAVGQIQEQHFKQQTTAAAELQQFEYVIGLSIVLMVAGAMFYGHRLARQMQLDADEKQRHVTLIEEAEARTRSILDTAAEGILTFDAAGRIESFNKAAERMFGYPDGAAVGCDVRRLIPALAAPLAPPAGSDGEPAAGQSFAIPGGEGSGRRRDGSDFPLELSASQVDVGRAPIYTAIVRDISERRQAGEALRIAAAAQEASRAKSQFLANMSHEIRTPMNGVLGMTEMLLDTRLSAAQRRLAETVHRSGETLLAIIDDILDLSKIEAGKLEFESVDFNPRDLTEEVAQLMAESADKKGLELLCRVADNVPPGLRGAPSRLRQVLTNLIGNAIKFTEHGQVLVDVSLAASGIDQAAPGSTLHFAVKDTGIGIPHAVQERLFTAFTQADNSTTRRYGGTGLGLAISKELVERMGGQIGVHSKAGHGAEFWFTVRLAPPSTPAAATPPGSEWLDGGRALIVAGKSTSRRTLENYLRALGLRVRCVEAGDEGIDLLRRAAGTRNGYRLAIVDDRLGARQALAFGRAVQADSGLAGMALLLLVPASTREIAKGMRAAGFHTLIQQPLRQSDLRQKIDAAIGAPHPEAAPASTNGPTTLNGVRVLLAEDNPVNQDVTRTMLESLDCDVHIVNSGAQALTALTQARFDIVLMDCQMPGMDGFATTAEIRARRLTRPQPPTDPASPHRLPIIALTANALKGDREECLAAGMDDYLAKPFRRQALRRIIERWVGAPAAPRPPLAAAPAAAAVETLDRRPLEQICRNQPAGAPSPIGGLLERYYANAGEMIAALGRAAALADTEALARAAHSLRSGSAILGARKLAGLCGEIERAARAGELQDIAQHIDAIENEYGAVRTALEALR
ncbi:MAG: multi-sensor hybrid histidine kinase [Proteobacteria bacterium]|nr:multi-sensor hybrid histidine kinase [Pseudomonadota bacterium]